MKRHSTARKIGFLAFLCLPWGTTQAQHGKVEGGSIYNWPYKGDTWTGEIVAIDQDTRQIALQYTDKKGRVERFDAKLLPNFKVSVKDHPDEKVSSLNVGDKILLYYVATGQKYPSQDGQGKKVDAVAAENLVFKGEVIPAKKQK